MKKKQLLLWLSFCLVAFTNQLYAQGQLQFEKETHEFGNIPQGIPVSYEFKFKNTGNEPVIISNVQASCGCTTPEWTNTPVMPGKTGSIKAAYNAAGMGAFNKSITVTSNAANNTQVVYVKGTVVDKSEIKASYTPEQKLKSARVSIKNNTHDFGKLETGQKAVTRIVLKNTGKEDLIISGISAACNCVSHKILNDKIKAGTEGIVELTYIPKVLGNRTEVVSINSNDIITPEVKVSLKAKVVQSLSAQSIIKESSNAVPFK
jgi:hypothetical protein